MFKFFLYILLGIYISLRSEYLLVNRDMVIDIKKRKNKFKTYFINPKREYINKWRYLYNKDNSVKKIGSVILAIIPLLYFMYNSITGENPSTIIMYVIYPFLLQIVNIVFETIGIDNNLYISDMYKERILAKKYGLILHMKKITVVSITTVIFFYT